MQPVRCRCDPVCIFCRDCEQSEPQEIRQAPQRKHPSEPELFQEQPKDREKENLRDLTDRHDRSNIRRIKSNRLKKRRGTDEIHLMDHRNRKCGKRHHQQTRFLEQSKRIEKCKRMLAAPSRRSLGKNDHCPNSIQNCTDSRNLQSRRDQSSLIHLRITRKERRQRRKLQTRLQPDQRERIGRNNPPDRPPSPHRTKAPIRILQMRKRDRVRQRQRRHIRHRIRDRKRHERTVRMRVKSHELQHATHNQQNPEILLRIQKPISDLTCKKRRAHRTDRSGKTQDPTNLRPAKPQPPTDMFSCIIENRIRTQIARKVRQPNPPHRVLKEHHHRQRTNPGFLHGSLFLLCVHRDRHQNSHQQNGKATLEVAVYQNPQPSAPQTVYHLPTTTPPRARTQV